MVKVDIILDNSRIFLFPASVAPTPGENDNAPVPPDDTTVRGVVAITSDHRARIGPVRLVWEVARELRAEDATWGKRDVLAKFESQVTEDDSWAESGITRLGFTFQIPSLLPPTCETVFDRTSHTLVASVLDPAPEYSLGPVPEYEDHGFSSFPRGSIGSMSDWNFPTEGSRRSSLLSEASGSRRSSIESGRSSVAPGFIDTESTSRRSSLADSSSRRSSLFSSRRGSAEAHGESGQEKKKKKGSLFGGFKRKSSASTDSKTDDAPASDRLPRDTPKCDGIELDDWLLPSCANHIKPLEIISCSAPKGEICTVDWTKNTHTTGLGHSEKFVHSDIFSLGSGVNFDYKVADIPASTTVHNIRLSLCQSTKAANGASEEEVFTLFSRGSAWQHVWRGEIGRTWDAQDHKSRSGGDTPNPAIPQVSLLGVIAGPSSLRIRTKARLPTSIAGAVATSPKLLDNRLSRITHRLRIETVFSVLGEDESGHPLPLGKVAKNGKPADGIRRRTWVDHEVTIGSCCITPENILVPTYSASPDAPVGQAQQRARIQARSELASFEIPRTVTRTTSANVRSQRSDSVESWPSDAATRLARHACDNDSRCLCFHGDAVIAEMIGSLEKPAQGSSAAPLLVDFSGLIKSLYIPTIDRVEIEAAMALEIPA